MMGRICGNSAPPGGFMRSDGLVIAPGSIRASEKAFSLYPSEVLADYCMKTNYEPAFSTPGK